MNLKIIFTIIVALIHAYIWYLEMFLWTKKKGIKAFNLKSKEFADETKILAANQGLYNLFIAAGLLWSLTYNKEDSVLFFLTCVTVAGIYGSYSTKKISIFYIQTIPALLTLLLTLFN
ncbi:DUF1304 domain-containing protein [uncultured Polaribacter sp.]|uniref:DUF1304 domain-containing protein n=1 Tax=uncultured Polaribacter sp. TaxID=174711 RepID=UPI0026373AAA|nr:DUF1304 domain-containing protein [uncultured Polaribacter sp.]